jgi:hypothetical protein
LFAHDLLRSFLPRPRFLLRRFRRFHLRFDVLAFPAPRHTYSLTQIGMSVRDSYGKSCEESRADGAALRENGESRAHHTADGGLRDTREMFGENAAISKDSRFVCPVDAQEPAAARFFGLR